MEFDKKCLHFSFENVSTVLLRVCFHHFYPHTKWVYYLSNSSKLLFLGHMKHALLQQTIPSFGVGVNQKYFDLFRLCSHANRGSGVIQRP